MLSIRAIRRRIVADYVVIIHGQSGGTYGWRRIRAELLDEYELIVNRKLIKAVMQEQRLAGVPGIKVSRNPLADNAWTRICQEGLHHRWPQQTVAYRRHRASDP